MADKKITALTASTALSTDDLFHVVDSPASSPSNKKITTTNVFTKIPGSVGFATAETKTDSDTALTVATAIHFLAGSETTLASGTVQGQLKWIIATAVGSTTNVDITTSLGAVATVTFQAIGESVTLMWTGSAWAIVAFGSGATGSNGLTTTMDVS